MTMRRWRMCLLWQDGGDAGASGGGGDAGGVALADGTGAGGDDGDAGGPPTAATLARETLAGMGEDVSAAPVSAGRGRGPGGRFSKRDANGAGVLQPGGANPGGMNGTPGAAPQPADGVNPGEPLATDPGHAAALQTLAQLGVQLPDGMPPEVATAAADWMQGLFRDKYEPVARQVLERHQAVEAQRAELEQFTGSDHYRVAAHLVENPDVFAAVQQYLQGGGPAAGGPGGELPGGLAAIDPNQLDETGRALYAGLSGATQQMQALRAQHQEMSQALRETREWIATRDQADERAQTERVQTETSRDLQGAIATASQQYGFDVRSYKPQFKEAVGYATQVVEAGLYRWQQAGGRGPRPTFDVNQLLAQGFKRAGFEQLRDARKRQAGTAVAPPQNRRRLSAGSAAVDDLVQEGLAAADAAGIR